MTLENNSRKLDGAKAIVEVAREPLLILDQQLRVQLASRTFYAKFNLTPAQTENRPLRELCNGMWDNPELTKVLQRCANGGEFNDYKIERDIAGLGKWMLLLSARCFQEAGGTGMFALSIDDITERRSNELEIVRHRQWLATTLSSIGDAVVATDGEARVTFINSTAQRLTGWKESEALGRPLLEVFNIVNEDTRLLVESPVTKALRSGAIVGLANHTVLLARDGTEYPIDDSAAPIRDPSGQVLGVVLVFHDISERRAAERVHSRLVEIVESTDDAIIAKDLNGVITAWNQGAEKLFGYTSEEAIGKSILMIIPEDRKNEEEAVLGSIRKGERIDHFETIRQRKDGTHVEISLTVSPLRNRRGEIVGVSKIARDITERKRIQAQLQVHLMNEQTMRLEAENANRSKDLFLATLSHELRTPLNAIVGWLRILRGPTCTSEDLQEGLEVIYRNTKAQVQLVEDVLDVSRIVAGKLKLTVQACDFEAIIHAAMDSVETAAQAKGVQIEVRGDHTAAQGACDAGRIQQVVWNLLSNAIKFTPKGGRVLVSLERHASKTRIVVSDTGQGIAPEFLPFVFDRFRQADSSTRRRVGGLGLGLSIVKQLVELHGGTVQAQSPGEGKGATFTVDLPIAAVQETVAIRSDVQDAMTVQSPVSCGTTVQLQGLRIVIVDDEPDARRVVKRLLQEYGAIVTSASNVQEALAAVECERPDLLISDIAMPEEDGYDLIRQVRARGIDAKTLPAVALTAFADKAFARSALMAGYQVHVAKPVEPGDLVTVVASLAGRTG